jgi:hypothetical protein
MTGECEVLEVTASTIRINDRLLVDGRQVTVVDLISLPRGGKLLRFDRGRHRRVGAAVPFIVVRPVPQSSVGRRR